MPYAPTTSVFPSERRSLGIAKESVAGTGVNQLYTVPVKGFVPEDKVTGLQDESLRSAMAAQYGYVQGPYVADITIDASPVYGDTIGHFLLNIFGDYTATGTQSGTLATTINHVGGYAAGTTGAVTIAAGVGFAAGYVSISDTGLNNSEVVQISSATGTSVVIAAATPTRFAHNNAANVTQVTGPYTHTFALLNGTGNAQPPTHTITDLNYINSVQSRWYPFARFSEIQIVGNAEQFFTWSGKAMGFANAIPSTTPTVSISSVAATPAWNSTVGIGGTVANAPVYNVMEYSVTLTRVVEPYFTANGQQNPYTLGAGKFSAAGKFNFGPAAAQTGTANTTGDYPLLDLLNNTQPQLQIIATNGLAGVNLVKLQIDAQVCAFDTAVIEPSKALLGFNDTATFEANTANVGNSAGYGPVTITLTNNQPTF